MRLKSKVKTFKRVYLMKATQLEHGYYVDILTGALIKYQYSIKDDMNEGEELIYMFSHNPVGWNIK